jgi:ADP-ribose pyrophosphatase YjhB (NUDIX family)
MLTSYLKKLLELGLVIKSQDKYSLTDAGKDYSNLLDDELQVEKQPKSSVIVRAVRRSPTGHYEHLLSRRLRQPYYGKVGRLTGKIKFGESFAQAAARELFEETGLVAKQLYLEEIYRKMRKNPHGEWVQDVVFYIFLATHLTGTLISQTEFQENFWITKSELSSRSDLDTFDDLELDDSLTPKPLHLAEKIGVSKDY